MMTRRPRYIALTTVGVLLFVNYLHEILFRIAAYRGLYRDHPFYVPEGIDKLAGATVCVFAVWLMYRASLAGVGQKLGFSAPILPAIAFALVASSPMLIGFAFTRRLTPHVELFPLLFLTIFSPLVEEIEFRGFGVRQLQDGTRWPFWIVVWPSTVFSGLGHIEQGQSFQEMMGLLLLTGTGGLIFAWLVYKWQSLWIAVALHVLMNLWWELFSVAKTAIGGWFDFAVQTMTMLLAIIITLYSKRSRKIVGASGA
jgi:membrane protease YdiL (CAAX protease family)